MNRITRLKIENFRRLKSLDLEMRPLGVMVGANGCGKTSIFDALSLLKAAVEGKLSEKMSDLGGFSSNVTLDGSETMTFGIGIEGKNTKEYYYEIHLKSEGRAFQLQDEIFPDTKIDAGFFGVLDVGCRAPIRLPQHISPEFLPKPNGENLLSVLYNLREQQPEAYNEIIDTLKIAFPGFESLTLPNVAAGMMSLAWNDRNFRNALYQHQMSEGMIRMLWLTAITLNPYLTPLTMIDEPEVSLHPELLAILVGCFRKATACTQLLAATHSTDLIRNLHPSEVLVLDMDENGMTSARWGDDPELNLEDWLRDYTLGDVWQMGLLGGRA